MKIAVIGAGKMGRWFAKFFLEQGISVVVSDKDKDKLLKIAEELKVETASNVDAVRSADKVLICVPIENFEDVIAEIHPYIRPEQEIMDICSVKELPVNIMHKYIKNGAILGTHPLFGPGVKSIKKPKFRSHPYQRQREKVSRRIRKLVGAERGKSVYYVPEGTR